MAEWGTLKDLEKVKKWFPEAFENVLEVGKWYIVTNIKTGSLGFKGIGQYTKEKPESGLLETDLGFNFIDVRGRIWRTNGNIRLATTKEVTEALKKEAVRLGLVVGNYALFGWTKEARRISEEIVWNERHNCLCSGQNVLMNSSGQWATVIPTKTIQEAEELLKELGHEIKIV